MPGPRRAVLQIIGHSSAAGDTYTSGPRGLMALIHKDLRLALELGHDLGLSLPGAALTQQLIQRVLEIED